MSRTFAIVTALASVLAVATVVAANADKVTICHIPPGNADNAHTITIGEPAVANHTSHGDTMGACPGDGSQGTGDQGSGGDNDNPGTPPADNNPPGDTTSPPTDTNPVPTTAATPGATSYWLWLLLIVLAAIAIGTYVALRRRKEQPP